MEKKLNIKTSRKIIKIIKIIINTNMTQKI